MKKAIILLLMLLALAMPAKAFYGNFHTHVECHADDGESTYDEMIDKAVSLGFDFIAMTSHGICDDELDKCSKETRILCIPGQEITTTKGHVLSLGWHMTADTLHSMEVAMGTIDMPVTEVAKWIHENNGIAIAAHPTTPEFKINTPDIAFFDAMECDHPGYRQAYKKAAESISKELNMACAYDSDAHNKKALSLMYNACDADELTQESMLESLKNGKCAKEQPLLAKIRRYISVSYWMP